VQCQRHAFLPIRPAGLVAYVCYRVCHVPVPAIQAGMT
jgi:hypothetical protein